MERTIGSDRLAGQRLKTLDLYRQLDLDGSNVAFF